jgi:hypothetical protein
MRVSLLRGRDETTVRAHLDEPADPAGR